jgi:hypothetical protein
VEGLGRSSPHRCPAPSEVDPNQCLGSPSKSVYPIWENIRDIGIFQNQSEKGRFRGPKVRYPLCVGPSPDGPFLALTLEEAIVREFYKEVAWVGFLFTWCRELLVGDLLETHS